MEEKNKNGAGSEKAGEEKDKEDKDKKEGEEDKKDENFDYSKELDRLNEKSGSKFTPLQKAEYAATKIAEEIAKLGGDPRKILSKKEDGDEDKDKGFKIESSEQLSEMISKIVQKEVGTVKSTFAQAEVDGRISKLGKTPEENKLIKYHFDNTIVQTGDINEDVENAYIIANKHRTKQIFEALTGKNKAEDGKSDGIGSGQKREDKARPKVNPQEEAFAKSKGLVWSDEDGRYVSPARLAHLESRKKK